MKIKQMIACLLAGVLMMGNLSAVCLAADSDHVPTSETPAETSEATPDEDTDSGEAIDTGFTLPEGMTLPDGLTVDEDGNLTFDMNGWDWTTTGGGAETETVEETITVGTVNVRSDTFLHLRTGPGMDQKIIGHLLRGAEVEVIGESGDWYEVMVPEMTGYVHKNYLDVSEQTITTVIPGTGAAEMDPQLLMMLFHLMMSGLDTSGTPGTTDVPDATDIPDATDTPDQPTDALTPDGNLTLVDDYAEDYEDGSGKQFITLVTKAGNVFYLVIDRDDKGEQNVHFLNLVDERDLLSLMDEEEAAQYTPSADTTPKPTEPEVTEPEDPKEDPGKDKEDKDKDGKKVNLAPVLILVLALAGGGGFFVYTKFFKGGKAKQQVKPDPDADYSEDDDDYGLPEDEDFDEDEQDEDEVLFDADDDEPV